MLCALDCRAEVSRCRRPFQLLSSMTKIIDCLRSIVPKEVLERWKSILCESVIMESDKFYCPFKDRSTMLVDDDFNRCPIHLVDEELIGYYLKGKVQGLEIKLEVIPLVETSKCDPWELPGVIEELASAVVGGVVLFSVNVPNKDAERRFE
ncbi:uncharacterized protein LOC110875657 [Helianthus annuus]|nr:uncharacterized protein LOC110875657 [Helianthus annuus]XP_035830024.1 uncharacterized protein LOC110875657 [Helianthus annuus]XP_035830026.1 uncharacterized protein LOC110875657 [Helianthus annuus]